MKERDLYAPVKAFLEGQGYTVKGEVGAADVVAMRGDDPPVIVELKLGFSLRLFQQGAARLALSPSVYLAVARPGAKAIGDNLILARAAGLGVMTIRPADRLLEVHCDPGGAGPRRSKKKVARLKKVFGRLRGDPNDGGATRHGLVTGYRQDALACARFLAVHGVSKGARVAGWTEVKEATRLMRDNHYGWFERVGPGTYGLTGAGVRGLADWGDVE